MSFFQIVFSQFLLSLYCFNWSLHFTEIHLKKRKKNRGIFRCILIDGKNSKTNDTTQIYCFSKTIKIVWVSYINYFKMMYFHTILWFISKFQFHAIFTGNILQSFNTFNRTYIIFQRQTNYTRINSPLLNHFLQHNLWTRYSYRNIIDSKSVFFLFQTNQFCFSPILETFI